jgi:DNA polymerase IV
MLPTLCRDCCEHVEPCSGACPDCGGGRLVAHVELCDLTIAHIDCDAFYASVEKRDRPELRDQPLIVGHPGGRGVVTTACYLARRFGVRSAMPMFKAAELCPQAVVLPPDMAKYKHVSDDIRAIFASATEIIEPLSLDEAYLDLSEGLGADERGAAPALAEIARRVEDEIGITVSIGLSCNKFLAKLASEMKKPRGFSVIGRAEAKTVLAPLSVRKINGVGAATAGRLEEMGLTTIGAMQGLSEMQLATQFGKFGRRLAQFAQGEDDRRVTPDRPTKSISAETTFRRDTASAAELIEIALRLSDRVASQLQRKGLGGGVVTLKLKTSDFKTLTRTKRLAQPTQRSAIIAEAAELLIRKDADGRSFRLIGVGADDLRPAAEADPPGLFDVA